MHRARVARAGAAGLVLPLFLPMLGVCGAPAPARDTHSLSCIWNVVNKSRPGEPWCEVEGQVDQKTSFYYGCGSHWAKPLGPLGVKVNSIKFWTELSETLEDVGQELWMNLLDIKLEENIKAAPPLVLSNPSANLLLPLWLPALIIVVLSIAVVVTFLVRLTVVIRNSRQVAELRSAQRGPSSPPALLDSPPPQHPEQ